MSINFEDKLSLFSDQWTPKTIARMNGELDFKLAKLHGEFVWHKHDDTDECFIVLKGGPLTIKLRGVKDRECVVLNEGEMYVVPKGIEHCPVAKEEVHVMLIEPVGVLNTGDKQDQQLTAEKNQWL